ncbi:hypothetical protein FQN54_007315 [Arachnomyces sp. PD_36]|nr:hypothetical protein FQN54_007315 [Arachnomyces sp. PD_36]
MKFTYALTAASALAGTAYSLPAATITTCVVSTDLSLIDPPAGISQDVLFDAAPSVGLIVAGLGLSEVAPGLVGLVDTTSNQVTVSGILAQVTEIPGVAPERVTQLVQGLTGLKTALENITDDALTAAVTKAINTVGNLIDLVDNLVKVATDGISDILGLDPALTLPGVDSVALAVLTQLASPLTILISTFGLEPLAPGLTALLTLLAAAA